MKNLKNTWPINQSARQAKGITLVALIITIIVLLILAMVSIRLIMNGGIIGRAERGTKAYSEAEVQEQIKLAYSEWQTAQFTGETRTAADFVKDRLNSTYGEGTVTNVTETEGVFTVTFADGKEYSYNVTTGTTEKVAKWSDNEDGTFTNSETGVKVQIGDVVNYDEGTGYTYTTDTTKGIGGSLGNSGNTDSNGKYVLESKTYTTEDLTWRVLGVNESGQIELISENPTSNNVFLANEEGYLYGPDELNKMCDNLYGKGTGAQGARSLKLEDIDKLAGIKTDVDRKELNSDYGTKWKYRYPTTQEVSGTRYMQYNKDTGSGYSATWTNITSSNYQKFRMPGAAINTELNNSNSGYSPEIIFTNYSYEISQKVNQIAKDGKRMSDLLVKGNSTNTISQWLASCSECPYSARIRFKIKSICDGYIGEYMRYGIIEGIDMYVADGEEKCKGGNVRPVVTLSFNVKLSGSSESGWTIE